MTCGIYAIVNTVTGEEYIRSSTNIEVRWQTHRTSLKFKHHNKRFQRAWDAYGEDAFDFQIIEEIKYGPHIPVKRRHLDDILIAREAYHMNQRKPMYNGTWLDPEPRRRVSLALPRTLVARIDVLAESKEVSRSMILEYMIPGILDVVEQELNALEGRLEDSLNTEHFRIMPPEVFF